MNTWSSKLKNLSKNVKKKIFLGGLFSCFNDCGICCYGYCCPACLYGENAEKIDGSSCFASGCLWYLLSGWGLCCLVHKGKRKALRDRFQIQEDCNDCAVTTFCGSCAICQEARELKFRLSSSAGICT
jgi:Cys-rich protein (TIGR01571 family)